MISPVRSPPCRTTAALKVAIGFLSFGEREDAIDHWTEAMQGNGSVHEIGAAAHADRAEGDAATGRSHRRRVENTGVRWLAAELYRHKGQLLQRQGHSEAAEELYRNALSIAQEQGAKLWELRAAVSLARLCCDQGRRRAEARDLLAPVYGWFTEGFNTPDLKEAKALLEELGRHA
jgi:predicted ATPase